MIACPSKGLRSATGDSLFLAHLPCHNHEISIAGNGELCEICVFPIPNSSSSDGIGSICIDAYNEKDGYFKI